MTVRPPYKTREVGGMRCGATRRDATRRDSTRRDMMRCGILLFWSPVRLGEIQPLYISESAGVKPSEIQIRSSWIGRRETGRGEIGWSGPSSLDPK